MTVGGQGSKHSTKVIINESRLQSTQRHLLATASPGPGPGREAGGAAGRNGRWDPYKQEQDLVVTRQQGQGDDDFELDMEGDEAYSQLLREISAGEGGGDAGALS